VCGVSTALFDINRPLQHVNFVGWLGRECGDHRTVGDYRAWCHGCSEWCYSSGIDAGCAGCRLPGLESTEKAYWALRRTLDSLIVAADENGKKKITVAAIEAALAHDSESESDPWAGTRMGSTVGICHAAAPTWEDATKVINHHDKNHPTNPDLLITVTHTDILRRFWSLGWVTP